MSKFNQDFVLGLQNQIRKLQLEVYSFKQAGVEKNQAYREAGELATSLWEKYYKDDAPHWELLTDTLGILTQIDNMTCGLTRKSQWISCKDRLPTKYGEYLVYGNCTNSGLKHDLATFYKGKFEKHNQPIMWQALPIPKEF